MVPLEEYGVTYFEHYGYYNRADRIGLSSIYKTDMFTKTRPKGVLGTPLGLFKIGNYVPIR